MCIVGDGFKLYFSDGFFAGCSHRLDMFLMAVWGIVTHFNVMWVAIQFVYRYTLVCLSQR